MGLFLKGRTKPDIKREVRAIITARRVAKTSILSVGFFWRGGRGGGGGDDRCN